MDIVTGKDLPASFTWKNDHYTNGSINIYGLDLVQPDEQMSAKTYSNYTRQIINNIQSNNKLPILVGGTGLYIKSVVDNLDLANIPQNKTLRKKLTKKSAPELFKILQNTNKKLANSLNNSDKNNPTRLIRKIEIGEYLKTNSINKTTPPAYDILWVGLKADLNYLSKKIKKRVEDRKGDSLKKEIAYLKKHNYLKKMPVTIGYKSFETWTKDEIDYAKRQLTWFKKEPRITWFNIVNNDFNKQVEDTVKKWHNKEYQWPNLKKLKLPTEQ